MDNLFSDIKNFGVKYIPNMYFESTKKEEEKLTIWNEGEPTEYLFEKEIICPVCGNTFKTTKLKSRRARLVNVETDLRPEYNVVDSVAYDTISCTFCRYTASNTNFDDVTQEHKDLLINGIANNVTKNEHSFVYTYEYAMDRYKFAILSSRIKKAPNSECAFYFMKLAWLNRAVGDKVREYYFLEQAYEGYCKAFNEEDFPIMGNDEHTFKLIAGEIARRIGRTEEAKKWIGSLLVDRTIADKIKQRAQDIKHLILEDLKK